MTTDEHAVTAGPNAARWRSPAGLGLLVGLGGLVMVGVVGGVVGLPAGMAAARRPRAVLVAAGLALFVTAALTVLERPLSESEIAGFPDNHPLADVTAAIAGVLLLAGLAGILAHRDRSPAPRMTAEGPDGAAPRMQTSTIAAFLAVTLLAALLLWRLGDRSWEVAALPVAIAVLVIGIALVLRPLLRSGPTP